MASEEFFVTLPSNTKSWTGVQNTSSKFHIRLPMTLDLQGSDWSVALADITYPYTWQNVGLNGASDGSLIVHLNPSNQKLRVQIPLRNYATVEQLIETLNRQLLVTGARLTPILEAEEGERHYLAYKMPSGVKVPTKFHSMTAKKTLSELNLLSGIRFAFDKKKERVQLKITKFGGIAFTVYLSPLLQYLLGFQTAQRLRGFSSGQHTAEYFVDLTGGASNLYVYCNVVKPQIVGDGMASLLRVVPIRTTGISYGQPITHIFNTPHFVPLLLKRVEAIEMSINTAAGKPMNFQFGTVLVTLRFRRQRARL